MKTQDGVADDWPMTYEELESYMDLNDRMMGVSGLRGDPAYPPKPERPCPPLSIRPGGELLAKGFDKLGWHWWASDTAISSVTYDGRQPDTGGYLRSLASTDLIFWAEGAPTGRPAQDPRQGAGRFWSTIPAGPRACCITTPTATFWSRKPRPW